MKKKKRVFYFISFFLSLALIFGAVSVFYHVKYPWETNQIYVAIEIICVYVGIHHIKVLWKGGFQQQFARKEEYEVTWSCFLPPRRNLASSYFSQTKTTQETKQPRKYPLLFS